MPELPEVQTVVNTLRPKAIGRTIQRVQMNRSDIHAPPSADPASLLTGRAIVDITRRAKRIVFTLDNATRFYVHLGMTGQLTVEPAAQPARPHTHMVLDLGEKTQGRRVKDELAGRGRPGPAGPPSFVAPPALQLRFRDSRRFGGVFFCDASQPHDAGIGPEPLTLSPRRLARRLATTRRPLKPALLGQHLIAGLGNIYVDEALHRAGLHPLRPSNTLSVVETARLNRAIKTVLRRAIRLGGSSISDYVDANGASGRAQTRHAVYAREGQPCRTCRHPIERIVLGGRSTHFCPQCQPAA